ADQERYAAMLAHAVLEAESRRPQQMQRREPIAETTDRLERVARSPSALAELAELKLYLGDLAAPASAATRAPHQGPDCFGCLHTLGAVGFAAGAPTDALEIERMAAALAPEGRIGDNVRRTLEIYTHAARTAATGAVSGQRNPR